MSGTREGGKKAGETNRKKYGENFYKEIGAKGGAKGRTGGFYGKPELAREAGRKGGTISRRGKSIKFDMAYEKAGDTKAVYDTSGVGMDGDSVPSPSSKLSRAFNRILK